MNYKDKLKKIIGSKYFIPCFVLAINILFFVIYNILFELRYETVDDFTIINIISKLDGTYSIYSVYIHPILSFIIMLLYKTGININWYTITMLFIQFISFTVIGIVLLNKDKKIGTVFYIVIINVLYSKILTIINYTSIATVATLAGVIAVIYYLEKDSKKSKIIGLILVTVGIMLRSKSIMIVLPFYIIYSLYYTKHNKNKKALKMLLIIMIIFAILYISNLIIYKINPVYDKYTEFNNVRSYFFDSNILDYEKNEEIFKECGWTYNDQKTLYSYSLSDENFYTTENLLNLKEHINIKPENIKGKLYSSFLLTYILTQKVYLWLFIGICLLVLLSLITKKNRKLTFAFFIIFILLYYVLIYMKPVYRVIISVYITAFVMMAYILTENDLIEKDNKSKIEKIILLFIAIFYIAIDSRFLYTDVKNYHKENYLIIKDVITYTNSHKENAYVYPNVFQNISLAYSIYEKIDDNTFSNLQHMSDWAIYNQEYYDFKERYSLNDIMKDLYEKDNLYIISGNAIGADGQTYKNHIEVIKQYIKEHYNKDVQYEVIKEFSDSIKIYKIHEIK